jgi:hypothetical protein
MGRPLISGHDISTSGEFLLEIPLSILFHGVPYGSLSLGMGSGIPGAPGKAFQVSCVSLTLTPTLSLFP